MKNRVTQVTDHLYVTANLDAEEVILTCTLPSEVGCCTPLDEDDWEDLSEAVQESFEYLRRFC